MPRPSSANRSCEDSSLPQGSVVLATVLLVLVAGIVLIVRGLV